MNMNILLQWIEKNLSIIAVLLAFISLMLSIIFAVCCTIDAKNQKIKHIFKKLLSYRYHVFHIIVLFCLTLYIFANWEECTSMQFFSQFDGNNILFLVWIILGFLIIYEVEGKGIRVAKHKHEEAQQNINNAKLEYELEAMLKQINGSSSHLGKTHQSEEGEKNGSSN